jgi:glycosyltransferase involved in cell wall biosynthesis
MTQDEEENIDQALGCVVHDFNQVIVTDSFSTDRTATICREHPEVKLYQNQFLSWADQRNWMLANCSIQNDIVLFLDADECLIPEFIQELRKILKSAKHFDSIYISVKYIFFGSHLRHAYGHPKIRRIFRREGLTFSGVGAREYANTEGVALLMKTKIIHRDRKALSCWIDKHNRNAAREAELFMTKGEVSFSFARDLPLSLRRTIWIRNVIWDRLPLMVRPCLYFIYRYIVRLGILDRRAGFIYCYLHAFWYQSLIDIKILEKKAKKS